MTKPHFQTDEHMRPGMEVERHLRMYGHLPELGCCEHDQPRTAKEREELNDSWFPTD